MKDSYVYEGTNVLKNKLDIKDEVTLEKAESDFASSKFKPNTRRYGIYML